MKGNARLAKVVVSPYFSQRVTRSSAASASHTADTTIVKREKPKPEQPEVVSAAKSRKLSEAPSQRKHVSIKYEDNATRTELECDNGEADIMPGSVDLMNNQWEAPNWREHLMNISEMRKKRDAPVDLMGCDKLQDDQAEPEVRRYHVLVSLMLSSQTKDQVTAAAMGKLRAHGLEVPNILRTADKKLGELIYPVGFWKKKVVYIKETTKILRDAYNCDIPPTVKELVKLPGVGPKMAHIIMDVAWGQLTGIGVDTHVHRICNRLQWVPKPTKNPEDTRKAVEAWLPRDKWREMNILMVGFGQQTCLPIGPRCNDCLNQTICPHSKTATKGHKPQKKAKTT